MFKPTTPIDGFPLLLVSLIYIAEKLVFGVVIPEQTIDWDLEDFCFSDFFSVAVLGSRISISLMSATNDSTSETTLTLSFIFGFITTSVPT